jgi:dihydrofolate reductase
MSRLVVINHLTLDGVMQAPGRADEDPRGGFEHGGWAIPNNDEVMGQAIGRHMVGGPLLLGRVTYEALYAYWPHQTDNPFTEALNRTQKYVVSTTLTELPWVNSTLVSGDAAAAVAELKERSDQDIVVLGSGELIQTLRQHDLIEEYLLLIHPLVLGSGRRMFPEGGAKGALQLVDSVASTKGVVIATYRPA